MNEKAVYGPYFTALAGINSDGGMDHIMIKDGAFDGASVVTFIRKLRSLYQGIKLAVFLDNLSAHKTNDVMNTFRELDITPIFNATYAPDFNPIETVFAQVKLQYKAHRLNMLANDKDIDETKLIRKAFKSVRNETIQKCISRSLKLL